MIGENGSGKTTILKSIMGLYREYSGEIKVNGIINTDPSAFKDVSYIDANLTFPLFMKPKRFLYWVARNAGYDKTNTKHLINSCLIEFGLIKYRRFQLNKMSVGDRIKLLLIKAIIEKPKILIFDEPSTNIDTVANEFIYKQLQQLKKQGVTILMSTESFSDVQRYVTEVTILNKDGRIKYCGTRARNISLRRIYNEYTDKTQKEEEHEEHENENPVS